MNLHQTASQSCGIADVSRGKATSIRRSSSLGMDGLDVDTCRKSYSYQPLGVEGRMFYSQCAYISIKSSVSDFSVIIVFLLLSGNFPHVKNCIEQT